MRSPFISDLELVCWDMAGTAMIDNGPVLEVFWSTKVLDVLDDESADEPGVSEVPGTGATVETPLGLGLQVASTAGLPNQTREALVDVLGRSDLFKRRVSLEEAGRGRRAPTCCSDAQCTPRPLR